MKVRTLTLILAAVTVLIVGVYVFAAVSPNQPSSTGTPVSTNCPASATSLAASTRLKPSLVFVLVEKSETYYKGNFIAQTRSVVKQMIPQVLEPGDRFFLAWISTDVQSNDISK